MDEYISREETVKKIKSCIMAANDAWESGYNTAMAEIMEWIKHMPTADVQPMKHGKWIDIYEWCKMHNSKPSGIGFYYWCSNCGKCVNHRTNYCCECGAKMDGEHDE